MGTEKQRPLRTIDNRLAERPLPVPSVLVSVAHRQGDTPVVHDRALTAHELSILSGLSVGHLANLRVSGGGPEYVKFGKGRHGAVRYMLSAATTCLNSQTRKSTSGSS